jgi:hypothetical protein
MFRATPLFPHSSSHFLICFSIKAFSIQLKNISWGISQLQRRRMVSHHHLNQHCRIPSSVLVLSLVLNGLKPEISSRPETSNLWKIWKIRFWGLWNLRFLADLKKHEISDRSENMRFLDRSAALHTRGYFRENYCWFYVWGVLAILLSCESFKAALVVKDVKYLATNGNSKYWKDSGDFKHLEFGSIFLGPGFHWWV